MSVPIVQIAAGWHHSLALTSKGDLYAAGHGAWGQLGIGETEIMPHFVHVNPLGSKNIKKIFAGGDHSWVVLDENNPEKLDYTPPAPLTASISPQKILHEIPNPELALEDYALLNMHKECLTNSTCKYRILP